MSTIQKSMKLQILIYKQYYDNSSMISVDIAQLKFSKKMEFKENAKENNPNMANSNRNYALGSI